MKNQFYTLFVVKVCLMILCQSATLFDQRGNLVFVNDLGGTAVAGTPWEEASTNWPGSNMFATFFYHDQTDSIYLFGGCTGNSAGWWSWRAYEACQGNTLDAMWKFNTSSLNWTFLTTEDEHPTYFANSQHVIDSDTGDVYLWISGIHASAVNIVWKLEINDTNLSFTKLAEGAVAGTSGEIGLSSPAYFPIDRMGACMWGATVDDHYLFWIFGGSDNGGWASAKPNDQWRFNTSSNEWTQLKSDGSTVNVETGEFHESNFPGNAQFCSGFRFNGEDEYFMLRGNQLWSFSIELEQWKFINSGSLQYGTKGIESSTVYPPGMVTHFPAGVGVSLPAVDQVKRHVFFVFGGYQGSPDYSNNNIWRLNVNNFRWTWMYGSSSGTHADFVGDAGAVTTDPTNPIFGQTGFPLLTMDGFSNIWMYGGVFEQPKSKLWLIPRCELPFDNLYDYPDATQRPCLTNCTAGSYYSLATDLCTVCPEGSWTGAATTLCYDCDIGKYSSSTGGSSIESCELCLPGKYEVSTGSSECSSCPAGEYSADVGATSSDVCTPCPAGRYNEKKGGSSVSSDCVDCPAGSWSGIVGSDSLGNCEPCLAGYYNDETGSSSGCKICPNREGMSCDELGAAQPFVKAGYWRDEINPENIFRCLPSSACKYTGLGSTICSDGYTGNKCSECETGFYRLNSNCQECPSEVMKWVGVSILTFVAIYILLRLSTPGRMAGVEIRMFVFWLQIISLYSSLSSEWPSELLDLFDLLSFANANMNIFYSPQCSTNSIGYFAWVYIKLAFTPMIVAFLCMLYGLSTLYTHYFPNGDYKSIFLISFSDVMVFLHLRRPLPGYAVSQPDEFKSSRYIYAIFSVMTLLYTMELASLFEPLNCVEQDGEVIILDEPTQKCYTDEWYTNMPYLFAFSIFYLLVIPLTLIFILVRYRNEVQTKWFQARFSLLTYSFSAEYYWFELVMMLKRCAVITLTDALSYRTSETSKIFVILGVLHTFALVEAILNPFRDHGLYNHNLIWTTTAIMLLMSTSVYSSESPSSAEKNSLTWILIAFVAFAVMFSIIRFYLRIHFVRQRRQKFQLEILRNIAREMNSFMISFRSYIDDIRMHDERSKAFHCKHWGLVTSRLGQVKSDIKEVSDTIKECCDRARIRPGSLWSASGMGRGMTDKALSILEDMEADEPGPSQENIIVLKSQSPVDVHEWIEAWSSEYGKTYWYSSDTKESVWTNPYPQNAASETKDDLVRVNIEPRSNIQPGREEHSSAEESTEEEKISDEKDED